MSDFMWCVVWQPRLHLTPLEKVFPVKSEAIEFIEWGKQYDEKTEYRLYEMKEVGNATP